MPRLRGEIVDLSVAIPRREVLRYLGYPRSKGPSERVLQRLEALEKLAAELVRGRGAFAFANRSDAEAVGMPNPSERVAFGVCTIGPALEQEEARLSDAGDPLGALILDAFGSAAAEEAAEMLHARVCAAVQNENLKAARRVSPGYGKWNVVRQADLLANLPTGEVGIRLTEASMMIPRKSVSFAVVLEPPGRATTRGRCAVCDLADCRYRREEAAASRAVEETNGHE